MDTFQVGNWFVCTSTRSATDGITEATLSPRAIRVLSALAEAQGDVVARSALLEAGWPNVAASDESLSQVMSELRRVFRRGPSAKTVIQTVAKSGYRISVPVLIEVEHDQFASSNNDHFDLEAYGLCLEARLVLSRSGPESLQIAERFARKAADRAPGFALAQAELSITLVQTGLGGLTEALERAKSAVRLGPNIARAHAALGYVFGALERWEQAEQSLCRALTCDHNDPDTHYLTARTLLSERNYVGATALAEQAAALDPENYRSLFLAARTASVFDPKRSRRLGEQTLKRIQNRLDADPHEPRAVNMLGPILAHLGEHHAALSSLDLECAKGNPLEFNDAVTRALIGDVTGAIKALEAIADSGWCNPVWLRAEPALAALASERSYRKLVQQLGVA